MENFTLYPLRYLCALSLACMLSACGGGGSSTDEDPLQPSPIPSSVATSSATTSDGKVEPASSSAISQAIGSSSSVASFSSSSEPEVIVPGSSSSVASSSSSDSQGGLPSSSSSQSAASVSSSSSSKSSSLSSLKSSSSSKSSVSSSSKSSSSSSVAALTTRIYFKNTLNYAMPRLHYFNVLPVRAASEWPGVAMKALGDDWFSYDFDSKITSAGIVFNDNGVPKTVDLAFIAPNNCYNNGLWQPAATCGIPVELSANAGVDRKANVNSRQVLSAAGSTGDYATASWASPAWTGVLTGAQVVTPVLEKIGTYTVTLTLTTATNQTVTDTMVMNVVAAAEGLPERPQLAAPLGFPTTGNVSAGKYRFVNAFPDLVEHFHSPVMVTNDGLNDLIYVVDKIGAIAVFPNKESVTKAEVREILDLRSTVLNNHESGLLSMAFDPAYATNGFIYIYYIYGQTDEFINGKSGDGILERWTVDNPANPTRVLADSKAELLRVPQIGPDHKGGLIRFHPTDGNLYIGIGDGGYGHTALPQNPPLTGPEGRTNNSGQDPATLRGKFIRIKPLATPVDGKYYEVPSDNPFVGVDGYLPEIWSMGHRNPWRWAFDSVAPYTLWETEVGQDGFEEVNLIQSGKNYGWPICEGTVNRGNFGGNPTKNCTTDFVAPVGGYDHASGLSIIGGLVYRGTALPNLTGSFIFGDYVSKRIWSIANDGLGKKLVSEAFPHNISSFGSDVNNNVLISTHGKEHGGPSSIFKMLDDDAAAVQIPATLSATGLFADLKALIPSHGVLEYQVNSKGWFDGGATRYFMAVPNDKTVGFDVDALWDLPVGTVLVKHMSIAAVGNANKAFTTSVLFRQDSGWQAANYRWNDAGTDADLVTDSATIADGSIANIQRKLYSGSGCAVCHKNSEGEMSPLATHTRQLNRAYSYQQNLNKNQLEVLNYIGLFTSGINNASSYERFSAPTDETASLTQRAKSYLHTNCAHCHGGTPMDMRYDTALANMHLVNENNRIKPGNPGDSLVYSYQTGDSNRMPNGTVTTNPEAETLFKAWIMELDQEAEQTGVAVKTSKTAPVIGDSITLTLEAVFNNGNKEPVTGAVTWTSSNTAVLPVSGTSASISTTANAVGSTTITGTSGSFSAQLQITVKEKTTEGVTAIEISPATVTLDTPRQLIAYGKNSDGSNESLFGSVTWAIVTGADVASISATGLLTPLKAGEAVAEATYQNLKARVNITSSGPKLVLRYKNTNNWPAVNAYLWTSANATTKEVKPWPGTAMTKGEDNWWYIGVATEHLSNGSINVIFNDGNGTKTNDLLNISKSSGYEDSTWTDWNGGLPSSGGTFTLSVTNGTITNEGTNNKFSAGRLVTVTADQPSIDSVFVGWSSDSVPYIVGDATKPVVQIVMPEKSLTMTATFKLASGDEFKNGRDKYAQLCAGCHGPNGTGGQQLNTLHTDNSKTLAWLASYINDFMPKGTPNVCTGTNAGDCAYDIANMIKNNAWIASESCVGANCSTHKSIDSRNLRLLTKEEYLNSVNDIFGMNFSADIMLPVNADGTVKNFSTVSSLSLDEGRTEGYKKIAEDMATQIITQKPFMSLAGGCSNATCIVTNIGKKIFRRPLTTAEITKYAGLYNATDAGKAVVRALLTSPKYLYRSEMGTLDSASGLYRLNNYEIATLLSYSLWVTTPDDALLTAAANANFNVQTEALRMLNDPRAEKGLRRFAQGWLIYDRYAFPAITDVKLQQYFKEETTRFIVENIKNNTPYRNMLKANYTYANKTLAQYYGLASVPANDNTWEKVLYPADDVRAETGIFAHGSVLASRVSSASDPSPIKRGLFVRDVLLCQVFQSPPAANFDPVRNDDDTNRDAVSRHTSDPSCRGCHQFIDGVGFGLEGLGSNALPRTTETTKSGMQKTVLHSGSIKSIFDTPETLLIQDSREDTYEEVTELADLIAESGQGSACYSRQFFRYMVGRAEDRITHNDEVIMRAYNADIKNGGGMKDMIIKMMTENNFILRRAN